MAIMHFNSDVTLPGDAEGILVSPFTQKQQETLVTASVEYGVNTCIKLDVYNSTHLHDSSQLVSLTASYFLTNKPFARNYHNQSH